VLPRLLELGNTGRGVWIVYSLLPLLLVPAGIGAAAALRNWAPNAMRAALVLAGTAAVSMFLGLARWPTLHWELAHGYATAAPDARVAIDAVFAGANRYLGNAIGEFLGELGLNGFFLLTGYAMMRSGRRWAGYAGVAAGVIGLLASLRNVTDAVAMVAEANNVVLPLWLIGLGVVLLRWHPGNRAATP